MRVGCWWMVLAMVGCGGDKDDPPPPPPDDTDTTPVVPTGDTSPPLPGPDLVWTPDTNYDFDATWTMALVPDVRAEFDIVVNWGAITTDAWGAPLVVTAVDRVILAEFNLSESEVVEALGNDAVRRTTAVTWWEIEAPSGVFANLSDFELDNGTTMDPATFFLESATKRWMVMLAADDGERLDLLAGTLLTAESMLAQTTQVALDDSSSAVTWSATMPTTALQTSSGHEVYTVDWKALEADVHGEEWDKTLADELFLGRYDGTQAAELADDVLDLAASAAEWFTMDVRNEDDTRLDLARDEGGTSFAGFTTEGLWIMGIRCTTCFGPAPLALAVVEVVEGE